MKIRFKELEIEISEHWVDSVVESVLKVEQFKTHTKSERDTALLQVLQELLRQVLQNAFPEKMCTHLGCLKKAAVNGKCMEHFTTAASTATAEEEGKS